MTTRPRHRRRLELAALAASLALVLASCQEETTERTRTPGRSLTNPTGNVRPDGSTSNNENPTTTGTLPPYLFSLDGAKKISPLALALQKAEESAMPAHDPSMNALRDLIKDVLDGAMAKPELKPGRNFSVTVSADDEPNAMALNEQVVVNKGILKIASALSLAMVLSHEVAHSLQNHSYRYEKEIATYDNSHADLKKKLDAALDTLLAAAYDEKTGAYVHRQADYDKAKPAWDAYWKELDIENRKIESEADIVGGQIASVGMGFTQKEVVEGFTSLFAEFKKLGGGSQTLPPGKYDVPKDQLIDFLQALLGRNTHPTDTERSDQIERVQTLFGKGTDTTLAKRWIQEYPSTVPGLSLTDDAPARAFLTLVDVDSGAEVKIARGGDDACGQLPDPRRGVLEDAVQRREGR